MSGGHRCRHPLLADHLGYEAARLVRRRRSRRGPGPAGHGQHSCCACCNVGPTNAALDTRVCCVCRSICELDKPRSICELEELGTVLVSVTA